MKPIVHPFAAGPSGWRTTLTLVAVAMLALCAGCKSCPQVLNKQTELFPDAYYKRLSASYFPDEKTTTAPATSLEQKVKEYNDSPTEAGRKKIRNQVLSDLMLLSDHYYSDYKNSLKNNKDLRDTVLSIATLGLTGTATAFGSESTKNALTFAATFLQGSKAVFDKNYFADSTIASLLSSMDGARATIKLSISEAMDGPTDAFSLQTGLSEVARYHQAGTLLEAMTHLSQIASSNAQQSKKELAVYTATKTKPAAEAVPPPTN